MESSSEGAVITGGWVSIEALLIRPGESAHSHAADHLAALVTCSLPRAEMTSLAYRHIDAATVDPLTERQKRSDTNYEKVRLVEQHLRSNVRLTLTDGSDIAAEARVLAMVNDPASELSRIHEYVTESLCRLYNQRNLISHSGSLRSVALAATIRTAPSLVGAGLDRIIHAQLDTHGQLTALELVARAEVELGLVGSPGGRDLASLLN